MIKTTGEIALTQANRAYRAITGREAYLGWEKRKDGYVWYVFADDVSKRGYETAVAHMAKMIDEARAGRRTATCNGALANDHMAPGSSAR